MNQLLANAFVDELEKLASWRVQKPSGQDWSKPVQFGPKVDRDKKSEKKYVRKEVRKQYAKSTAGGGAIGAVLGLSALQLKRLKRTKPGRAAAIGTLIGAGMGALHGKTVSKKTKGKATRALRDRVKVKFENQQSYIDWVNAGINRGRYPLQRPDRQDYAFYGRGKKSYTVPLNKKGKK